MVLSAGDQLLTQPSEVLAQSMRLSKNPTSPPSAKSDLPLDERDSNWLGSELFTRGALAREPQVQGYATIVVGRVGCHASQDVSLLSHKQVRHNG